MLPRRQQVKARIGKGNQPTSRAETGQRMVEDRDLKIVRKRSPRQAAHDGIKLLARGKKLIEVILLGRRALEVKGRKPPRQCSDEGGIDLQAKVFRAGFQPFGDFPGERSRPRAEFQHSFGPVHFR